MKKRKFFYLFMLIVIMVLNGCGKENKSEDIDRNLSKAMIVKETLEDTGLYSLELANYNLYISNSKLDGGKLIRRGENYSFQGDVFIQDTEMTEILPVANRSTLTWYQPKDNGWELITKDMPNSEMDYNITFNSDGYSSPYSQTTILSIDKLEGLPIQSKAHSTFGNNVKKYILKESLFSKNTLMIESKEEYFIDNNISIFDKLCLSTNNTEELKCQEDLGKKFYELTSLQPSSAPTENPICQNETSPEGSNSSCIVEIPSIAFSTLDEFLTYFKKGGEHFFLSSENMISPEDSYMSQFDRNGTIYYFKQTNKSTPERLRGYLKYQTLYGVEFYEMEVPEEYKNNSRRDDEYYHEGKQSEIFVELNGALQRGVWQKGLDWRITIEYNNKAINDFKEAIEKFINEGNYNIP